MTIVFFCLGCIVKFFFLLCDMVEVKVVTTQLVRIPVSVHLSVSLGQTPGTHPLTDPKLKTVCVQRHGLAL